MSFDKQNPIEPSKLMSAGDLYRAAFERLKNNKPERHSCQSEQCCQRGRQRSLSIKKSALSYFSLPKFKNILKRTRRNVHDFSIR